MGLRGMSGVLAPECIQGDDCFTPAISDWKGEEGDNNEFHTWKNETETLQPCNICLHFNFTFFCDKRNF